MVSGKLQKISDVVYCETDWHKLPAQLRRHHVKMMQAAQQTVYLSGLGMAVMRCSMENFSQVQIGQTQCEEGSFFLFSVGQ